MTTRETMRRMHDRCFCEQHRDELRDSYRALVVRGDFEEVEAEYTKGKEVLATELNDLQKEWLTEIEELYTPTAPMHLITVLMPDFIPAFSVTSQPPPEGEVRHGGCPRR